jgi:hypothetical protein
VATLHASCCVNINGKQRKYRTCWLMTKKDNFILGKWKSSVVMMMMMTTIFVGLTLPHSQNLRLNSACCCMIGKWNENLAGRGFGLEQTVGLHGQLPEGLRQPTKVSQNSRCLGGYADRTDSFLDCDDEDDLTTCRWTNWICRITSFKKFTKLSFFWNT